MDREKGLRLLIVDDENAITEFLEDFLKDYGYQLSVAGSAAAARSIMEREKFDLVLTDLNMPEESGLSLAGWMRKESPDTKIILMSGYLTQDLQNEHKKQSIDRILVKPFNIFSINDLIENVMGGN